MKKGLKFLSVLMLILGIVTLVVGVMDVVLLQSTGGGVMADALTALAVIVFVAGGLLDVIGGLLGLRASNHPAKAAGAIVFGLLALAAAVASAAMDLSVQNICACVVPLLYFICAISVKSRA